MSSKAPKKKSRGGVFKRLRARTQSEAIHLTQEEEWDTEVPNIRLSRVFAVVLVLHVVAVAGMFAFQMLNPDEAVPEEIAAAPLAPVSQATTEQGNTIATPATTAQPRIGDPAVEGLRHYRVQSGDDLLMIARRFSVSVDELEGLNGLDAGNKLYSGLILYIPNRQIKAAPPGDVEALLAESRSERIEPMNNPNSPGARLAAAEAQAALAPSPVPSGPAMGAVRQTSQTPGSQVAPPGPAPAPIAVPAPAPAVSAIAPAAPAVAAPVAPVVPAAKTVTGSVKVYTVESGDTAYGIGRKFGISHEKVLQANGIADARTLRPGQTLKIPISN